MGTAGAVHEAQPRSRRRALEIVPADLRVPAAMMLAAGYAVPHLPEGIVPACPLRTVTGIPCPLCGMTTSVVAALHLRLDDALRANPAGLLAALAALVLVAVPLRRRLSVPWFAGAIVLGSMWVFELFRFRVL